MNAVYSSPLSETEARDALIIDIMRAFDGVSRDGGVSLHEAGVIDDYGSQAARDEARKRDTETRWQDVPEDDLLREMVEYTFLDPVGFRYYLPAFLVVTLKYYQQDVSYNGDWMIYAFSHYPPEVDERVAILSQEQREIVARFLYFFVQFDPDGEDSDVRVALQALTNGWDKYLPSTD